MLKLTSVGYVHQSQDELLTIEVVLDAEFSRCVYPPCY
jgi:hypothetical protein